MTAVAKRKYTLEEYLELDRNAATRYEYFDGEIFDMAGGSPSHARISGNAYAVLQGKVEGGGCEAFNSEMRIFVPKALPYRYPDASVVCGEAVFNEIQGQQRLVNPVLLVEVLSPTTAAYDLGLKFTEYKSIASLREYVLIAQEQPLVIQYTRQAAGQWVRTDIEGLESVVRLESINVTLTLRELYQRVQFPAADGQTPGSE